MKKVKEWICGKAITLNLSNLTKIRFPLSRASLNRYVYKHQDVFILIFLIKADSNPPRVESGS